MRSYELPLRQEANLCPEVVHAIILYVLVINIKKLGFLRALNLIFISRMELYDYFRMVPGSIVILGVLSLRDQLMFQPQGSNCGVMLYFTPLLTQVSIFVF